MSLDRRHVRAAYERIRSRVRLTPTLEVDGVTSLDGLATSSVILKLEHTQHTGSFKPRGAFNRMLSEPSLPSSGVVAASGGNHGAAVAYAAESLGVPATIFVPEVTSPVKVDRIRGYGAEVVVVGERYDDARVAADRHAVLIGALSIHAYDHPAVVSGAGTVGLELEQQVDDLDTVLVAVGGGGLVGGIAAWFAQRPMVRVVAVEPEGMPTLYAAKRAGTPVDVDVNGIAADSLGARRIGDVSFEICTAAHVRTLLVDDDAIVAAQRWLWERVRIVAEPGGATALAALLSGVYRPESDTGERIAVIVCGANTSTLPA